jgi:putative transposase
MGRGKKYRPEQVVNLLRQIEVGVANGETTALACEEAGIVEQTYFRWRKEYGGLQVDQAKRLKELEQENAKLKRVVAELSLDKLVLKVLRNRSHEGGCGSKTACACGSGRSDRTISGATTSSAHERTMGEVCASSTSSKSSLENA